MYCVTNFIFVFAKNSFINDILITFTFLAQMYKDFLYFVDHLHLLKFGCLRLRPVSVYHGRGISHHLCYRRGHHPRLICPSHHRHPMAGKTVT